MKMNVKTSVDLATDGLRDLILSRELVAGEPIRQEALSERLDVSRTPLRQALQILSEEGLVIQTDYRGARVAAIKPEDVRDLFDMRLALEPIALGEAIARMTKIDLAQAEMALDEAENVASPMRLSKLNWHFHRTLYAPCGRAMLLDVIEKLNRNASRAEIIALSIARRVERSACEHEKLLQACRNGDVDKAGKALNDHLWAARRDAIAAVENRMENE